MIVRSRIDLVDGIDETEAFIADKQASAFKPTVFKTAKEFFPAFRVFFHSLSSTDNFSIAIVVYRYGNKDGYVFEITAPVSFEIDTVQIDIGIFGLERAVAPVLNMDIYFFVNSLIVPGDTLVPHKASVTSSTRRTDTPARYILMRASSTDASRRL